MLMREIRQLAVMPIPENISDDELFFHLFVWKDEDFYDEDWRMFFDYEMKEHTTVGDYDTIGQTIISITTPESATIRYFLGTWSEHRRTGVDEDSFGIVEVKPVVTTVYQNI